jgi:DNA repair protein RecN (Recombination protein N)
MLIELKVKNFAIIDKLELSLAPGFNVLSGETGAGKSVLLKSLALLMGEKGDPEVVRQGTDEATVEGCFDLSERPDVRNRLVDFGLASDEDRLIVRRVLASHGKSKVYLNGALSPLSALRALVAPLIEVSSTPLIEMTGQHESRHLQNKSYHLDLLDIFSKAWNERLELETEFRRHQDALKELSDLTEQEQAREQRLDYLRFQREEIESLALTPGAIEAVESRLTKMRHQTRILDFCEQFESWMQSPDDSILNRVSSLITKSAELRAVDPEIDRRLQSLRDAKALLEDASLELANYRRTLEVDQEQKVRDEEYLSRARKLQKKFGASTEDILTALQNLRSSNWPTRANVKTYWKKRL